MLQYITSTSSPVPVTEQVRQVLEGGCRWIQVRMKDASDEEIAGVIEEIKPMCLDKEAFLILNDRVELAKTLWTLAVFISARRICFRLRQDLFSVRQP